MSYAMPWGKNRTPEISRTPSHRRSASSSVVAAAPSYSKVDIAIVCESTYPYLTGGLSAVVHQIAEAHPEYSIGIIHITWDSTSPAVPKYDMPDQVAWVMPV